MLRLLLFSVIAVLCLTACQQNKSSPGGDDSIGAAAQSSTLIDSNGNSVTLADVIGKEPTVLVFYRGVW